MRQGIFLPDSASSADSLTVSVKSYVQSHASTSAHTLKIPNSGSHIPLFGHTNIKHTRIGMGIALLLQLVCLTKARRPEFLASDNEIIYICKPIMMMMVIMIIIITLIQRYTHTNLRASSASNSAQCYYLALSRFTQSRQSHTHTHKRQNI